MTAPMALTPLDHPRILSVLFHPRTDAAPPPAPPGCYFDVPLSDGERLSGEFHPCGQKKVPLLLFFHGNGEIASDYRQLVPFFTDLGCDFLVMDYRGYGRSTSRPMASLLQTDALAVFDAIRQGATSIGTPGPILVMGRSLGSAAATAIAGSRKEGVAGLAIESGFSDTMALLRLLGADTEALGISGDISFQNKEAISCYTGPTLILHGQFDQIIPLPQAEQLHRAAGSRMAEKTVIEGADHNTLFYYGMDTYREAMQRLVDRIR